MIPGYFTDLRRTELRQDATVCIPWRPQPGRMEAYDRIRKFWAHFGFPVVVADSTDGTPYRRPDLIPFNLSRARNKAVAQAKTDYVIVADADTLPDIGAVIDSLDGFDGVTWPYQAYRHIPAEYADRPDLMTAPIDRNYTSSVGGIFICGNDLYWELGGSDENFISWGYEDNAFHLVAQTLSHVRRQPGVVFSFNHDGSHRDMTRTNPNRWRHELYRTCLGRPEMMRELIRR